MASQRVSSRSVGQLREDDEDDTDPAVRDILTRYPDNSGSPAANPSAKDRPAAAGSDDRPCGFTADSVFWTHAVARSGASVNAAAVRFG